MTRSPNAADAHAWRWLLLALLLFAFAFQGTRGVWSPDEGRYTDVALEMLSTQDWIHPRLHHEFTHFTKPPLTYWAVATSFAVFGKHEWAARLPYALAFVLTALLVAGMARQLRMARPWVAGAIYASLALPYAAAQIVTTDTLLAACTALYGYGFVAARAAATERARRGDVACLWLGVALAFMTKGPPGLLPLSALFVFAWTERDQRRLRHYITAEGLLGAVLLGTAWYAKVAWDAPQLVRYFLVEEVWHRVASNTMHRNGDALGALRVYVPTLLLGGLPWILPLLPCVVATLRAPRAWLARTRADADARLLQLWFWLPLAVFALSRSRLPFYLLPLFAPLALMAARAVSGWRVRRVVVIAAIGALLSLALRVYAAMGHWPQDDRALAGAITALRVQRVNEVAFVDTAPRYGLSLYLNAEVERIDFAGERHPAPQTQDLHSEVFEREGCRVWMVEAKQAARLEAQLREHAGAARVLGPVAGYVAMIVPGGECVMR